jgi:hypothetical protein
MPRVDGQAAGAQSSAGELQLDRGPIAASVGDARSSLGDATSGIGARPFVSAPAAWSVLLLGLIGLFVVMPRPTVARVRSWAMQIPLRVADHRGTRAGAIDRVDPDRYAQTSDPRWRQGHFVRAASRTRFGDH